MFWNWQRLYFSLLRIEFKRRMLCWELIQKGSLSELSGTVTHEEVLENLRGRLIMRIVWHKRAYERFLQVFARYAETGQNRTGPVVNGYMYSIRLTSS